MKSQNIAATVEEQSGAMTEVAAALQSLAELVANLQVIIEQYKY